MHRVKSAMAAIVAALLIAPLTAAALPASPPWARASVSARPHASHAAAELEAQEQLAGHTAPQVLDGTATRASHYNPAQKLRLTFAIQPPHLAEEEQFLKDLQTKGSPNFHKFLTASEWNARFAPSVEDEQKVVDWAAGQGLTVTDRFANRLLVNVEAPAGAIEKALGVTINNYQAGDEVDFANDRDPLLPASLSGIVESVQGLNNIQREHGASPASDTSKGPDYVPGSVLSAGAFDQKDGDSTKQPTAMSAPNGAAPDMTNGAIDPTDLYSSQAYNYAGLQALGHCCNPNNKATGSPPEASIAIAAFGPFLGGDIAEFRSAYPYLAYQYSVYYINGNFTCPQGQTTCPSQETTQDLEWAIATSNSFDTYKDTAHIYVYIGATPDNGTFTTMYNQMLSDGFARVLTTSWSCTEVYSCSTATMDARHAIFNAMVGQGWTLVAASGDRGSTDDCDFNNPAHAAVAYPASDPDFVAAGGTELELDSNGNWLSENAWQGATAAGSCAAEDGGSGGGVSAYYAQPSWQISLSALGQNRLVPDLALNADGLGQNIFFNGTLAGTGNGTSIVAPELAGFFAQENAYLLAIGNKCGANGTSACAPIGNPDGFIYGAGAGNGVAHSPFYDTTSGCNSNDVTTADGLLYFCAGAGYDLVTGWGSTNMMQLAWALNQQLIPTQGAPTVLFTGPPVNTWYNTNQTVAWTVNDSTPGSGIAGFTYGWDSIPADPSSEPNGGTGNSFYSGPAVIDANSGCLSLESGSCGAGVTQGCHTVNVEGWNNQGETTGDATYGPVCLDTAAPAIASSNNPAANSQGWNHTPVTVTLTATDSGGAAASGIGNTYYGVNAQCNTTTPANCTVYGAPINLTAEGTSDLVYFAQDNAGNFSAISSEQVNIDLTPPVTTASLSGALVNGVYNSAVQFTLHATDNLSAVAATYYQLDSGPQIPYNSQASSPAIISISTPATHTLRYWSIDNAGNTEAMNTRTIVIASTTTTSLADSPNPSAMGQSVSLMATVTATLGGTPTGSVTFYNGSSSLGSAPLSSGVATLATTALPSGQLILQASYNGVTNYLPSNSASLSQTVTVPAVQLSPSSLSFPQAQLNMSSSMPVTLTNLGTGNLTVSSIGVGGMNSSAFSYASTCIGIQIPPNGGCTIQITFTPRGAGTYTAALTINDNAPGGIQSIVLSGSGASGPAIEFAATTLSFPVTYVTKSTALPLTLMNIGTSTLKVKSISTTGADPSDFSHNSACIGVSIAPNTSCTMQMKFSPKASGSLSATVQFVDNAATSPQSIIMRGSGALFPAVKLSPTSLSFPAVKEGTSSTLPLTITNTGAGNLLVTTVSNVGPHPGYFLDSTACVGISILPEGTCTMQVTFTPASKGSFSATMKIADNAANSQQSVTLKGSGH
jgi:hypothetical protein